MSRFIIYPPPPPRALPCKRWSSCWNWSQGIELLPYHVLGRNKWEVMHIPYPLDGVQTPPHDKVARVIKEFNDNDISVICAN